MNSSERRGREIKPYERIRPMKQNFDEEVLDATHNGKLRNGGM
jgi:hypothetical protein